MSVSPFCTARACTEKGTAPASVSVPAGMASSTSPMVCCALASGAFRLPSPICTGIGRMTARAIVKARLQVAGSGAACGGPALECKCANGVACFMQQLG